ncbi:lysophospholipid acyltransferase 6-like isoform X2 [Dysidea avara]
MTLLLAIVGSCYVLLLTASPKVVQNYTMIWMLTCISAAHIYRLITDYGGYHLDFTGPLMVIVQRTTYVAFALHDGIARDPSSLNEDQQKQRIKQKPTPMEYFGYNFFFASFLAGPAVTYKQYHDFISGANFTSVKPPKSDEGKDHVEEPSNVGVVLKKTVAGIIMMALYVILNIYFPYEIILADMNFIKRLAVLFVAGFVIRARYYFIWIMSDSGCNAAGLGFSGYNKLGYAQWDIASGMDVFGIEFGTSLRNIVNSWNIATSNWLRRVCYERVKFVDHTIATFFLSAWWHGFYPAYYLLFVTIAMNTLAARKLRRVLRHHFQVNLFTKWGYDVFTWFCCMTCLNITCMCITLLYLGATLQHLGNYYYVTIWFPLLIIVLPIGRKSRREQKPESTDTTKEGQQTSTEPKETKSE